MSGNTDGLGYRFYRDLAEWWPLASPPEEYAEEAAELADLLEVAGQPGRQVLELGSGGGHNAVHLRRHAALTLVDASPEMLAMSRRLNPECEHVVGDMRSVRLGRRFDGVLVHDAIDYMTTRDDLRQAAATAFEHCRPGGVAVLAPDHTAETFRPGASCGGSDGPDGRGVRYLEWTHAPDPAGVTTDYAFLLRSPDGDVEVVHETHRTGLFGRHTWLEVLTEVGFDAEIHTERASGDREPRDLFVAHRPAGRDSDREGR